MDENLLRIPAQPFSPCPRILCQALEVQMVIILTAGQPKAQRCPVGQIKIMRSFVTRAWVGRGLVHALLTGLPVVSAVQDRNSQWVCK